MEKGQITGLVGVLIAVVIFGALLPLVSGTIADLGLTGTAATLAAMIPVMLVIGLVLGIIYFAVSRIRGGE